MKQLREIIGDLFIVALAVSHLWAFGMIVWTGGYWAVENNTVILYAEITFFFIAFLWGVERFIDDLKKRRERSTITYETIDGKWWVFHNGIKYRQLSDIEAAKVIWGDLE